MSKWNDPTTLANVIMALAAIASFVGSLYLYYRSQREQRELEARLVNNEVHLAAFEMLKEMPRAFRFLGITDADMKVLKNAGIKPEEVAFLNIHFRAGLFYHEVIGSDDISPYNPNHLRYISLNVPETRAGWKVIRKTMPDSTFKTKIDATVKLIESEKISE